MKKILLFGGIGLAVVAITAGVTFLLFGSKGSGGTTTKIQYVQTHFELGPTYTFPSRVVNLADPGANRYLKVTVVIAFTPQQDTQSMVNSKIEERMTVLEDKLTTILSEQTTDVLATTDGKEALKKAIIASMAPVLEELHIKDIYFPEFVMQ